MANNAETTQALPTLLLTRPQASAVRFAAKLDPAAAGRADLVISPLQEIVKLDIDVSLAGYAGVIFSSANGVLHGPDGNGMPAYCVGSQTGAAAKSRGWRVVQVAQDADAFVRAVMGVTPKGPLLHLSGTHQRGDIAARLTAAGLKADRTIVYDQQNLALNKAALDALCGEGPVVLPLFSPRTAAQFVAQAPETGKVYAIAMSAAVAQELTKEQLAGLQILAAPTAREMVHAVELLLLGDRLP